MRIAYLVNQYPKTSHSFIRREIEVVESKGIDVTRISIRRTREPLVDARDIAEAERTLHVLDGHFLKAVLAVFVVCGLHPIGFVRALRSAFHLGWRSRRGRLVHVIYLAEACVLRRMIARHKIDHVHAHFATNPATVALLCEDLGGPSFSFTFHGPEFFEYPTHKALGTKVARAAFSVAISHHGRSQLMRVSDHVHWRRIALIHCGVGREYLEHPPVPIPATNRLVCVGRLDPAKGHLVLMRAVTLLAAEGRKFEIVFVGDGELRSTIESMTQAQNLQNHIRCVGWKSGQDVIEEILAARALVLPSFEEGLPVVFMEALALERPVVSTFIAGIPELVKPEISGWLVPASSVGALSRVLREVLDATPEELQALGRCGAELVRANHDVAREAMRLAELFEKTVLEGRRGSEQREVQVNLMPSVQMHVKGDAR
ncbi:MAG: glycosyltransferase family 4 protein [Planctomycetes bacterium]|nr:glycosyltransferase family 4 protein [Planctomycetota bacterium]